tara:strand:+ start:420 stop:872 length:453 start_codon:yes stop_codon:yes gene_type:complete
MESVGPGQVFGEENFLRALLEDHVERTKRVGRGDGGRSKSGQPKQSNKEGKQGTEEDSSAVHEASGSSLEKVKSSGGVASYFTVSADMANSVVVYKFSPYKLWKLFIQQPEVRSVLSSQLFFLVPLFLSIYLSFRLSLSLSVCVCVYIYV